MKNIWTWVGIIILIAILGWGGYYGWQQKDTLESLQNELSGLQNQLANQTNSLQNQIGNSLGNFVPPLNNTISNGITNPVSPTAGWKTYSNSELGFSFKYPSTWKTVSLLKYVANSDWEKGTTYGSWTDQGPIYFDSGKAFGFGIYSQDYQNGLGTVITKKINVNWSKAELSANVGTGAIQILLAKKLSSKAILVVIYSSPECSPSIRVSVATPLDIANFPNLFIYIDKPEFYKDPIVISYQNKLDPETGDGCSLLVPYQEIADKIARGGYPILDSYIETARLIVDSVMVS